MRPADHLAVEHQRERRLDRDRDPVGERARLEPLDQLAQVGVVVDPASRGRAARRGRPVLLAEPGLDPGVEAGAEPGGRRRLAGHRPGQVGGERVGVGAQPGQRGGGQRRRQRHLDHVGARRAGPRRAAAPARRPTRATVALTASPARPAGRSRRRAAGRPARTVGAAAGAAQRLPAVCRRPATAAARRPRSQRVGPRPRRAGPATLGAPRPSPRAPRGRSAGRATGRAALAARPPAVGRDDEQVPGAGERDVAESELLLRLVRLRCRSANALRSAAVPPEHSAGRGRRRAAA